MSIFGELRPFFSLCQACGMIPYTMEYDSTTKQFKNFTFSWKSRATLWFIPMFILQILVPLAMSQLSKDIVADEIIDKQIPITVSILTGTTILFQMMELVLSRYIALRHYRRLKNIVTFGLKIERLLTLKRDLPSKCSLTKRFIIGFSLILVLVSEFI